MRIGILFGGKSREREISFAGGRTVYDLLDKSLFTPVPIFIDSNGNFILLDWQYLYKGSIRDFYPPVSYLPKGKDNYQIYIESLAHLSAEEQENAILKVGRKVNAEELKRLMDFAFLALHGPYGEDGSIQGILEFYEIPYSGSGILPSAIGIDKQVQKHFMKEMELDYADALYVKRDEWTKSTEAQQQLFEKTKTEFSLPVVLKSSSQGSSIGVSILKEWDFETFRARLNQSFFIREIKAEEWTVLNKEEKRYFVQQLCDIYEGTGLPLKSGEEIFYHPADVYQKLEDHFEENNADTITFESLQTESAALIEEFIDGKEFSCIVVEGENGEPIALPPTEIIKTDAIFNYRAKYLPGISRKVTPINLPEEKIEEIGYACEKLYQLLQFDVYARIDGIIRHDGKIFLNDPNTTSGMLPSSFFFHQAAEIGLSPSQFLTYIIHRSLKKRKEKSHKAFSIQPLIENLERKLKEAKGSGKEKFKIAVVLGGISSERHISVESGRNVFEKLSSSGKYEAIPVFLSEDKPGELAFYILPLNLLLKDNADDIREKSEHFEQQPIIRKIINKAKYITENFASSNYIFHPQKINMDALAEKVDAVFIALHGRPGEDGALQQILERYNLPYNGSGVKSSSITINKYITNEILQNAGFSVPAHYLVRKEDWNTEKDTLLNVIDEKISFPLIAKPADDGCSSAVKKIKNRDELIHFAEAIFRNEEEIGDNLMQELGLKANEEFPKKTFFVVEELVGPEDAAHFLEITGGMLTKYDANGKKQYEVFEPSEALASKGILSLEEKFLAGEGQNITPARFSSNHDDNRRISSRVKEELQRAAETLNIEGYCRIDAFVRIFDTHRVEVIFIEVNSLPGLTPATCIFHQAAINGYKPFDFLDNIINYGIEKARNTETNSAS